MKRFILLLTLGLISIAAVSGLYHRWRQSQAHSLLAGSGEEITLGGQTSRWLKDELRKPVVLADDIWNKQTSKVCSEFWRHVVDADMFQWMKEVDEVGWSHPEECRNELGETFKLWIDQVVMSCTTIAANKRSEEQTETCQNALASYRSKLVDLLSREQRNYVDMPIHLLVHKMYSELTTVRLEIERSLTELLTMIEALSQREPDWISGQRLMLATLIQRERFEADSDLKSQVGNRITAKLEEVRQRGLDTDTEISELLNYRIYFVGDANPADLVATPNLEQSGALDYLKAAIFCGRNQLEECRRAIDAALGEDSENIFYQQAQNVLSTLPGDSTDLSVVPFTIDLPLKPLKW